MPAVRATPPTKLYAAIREAGVSYQHLSRKSGYTANHIGAVARGERRGTQSFYILLSMLLGQEVRDDY